ncbi:MAG: alpha/beta hydrolase fold domain-containing protein [Lewinellaceae bacterium]|nr:alpha/beta hydrolase fold domain-containing protein [Lewinellaceae bacterium]
MFLKYLPLLFLLAAPVISGAQGRDFPRDTTYSIRIAYEKIRKTHPDVSPIQPGLPEGVAAKMDVVYANLNGRELHMDIFHPAQEKEEGYPGAILIHGGGWSSGTKAHQVPMAQQLAKRGYVTAAVEYRLSPEAPYPAAVYDLKAALRWLRAHAADYQLDPSKIAALGCSAGAQLASLLGTTNGMEKFEGENGYPEYSSAVQAVLNIDGIVSFVHPEAAAEGDAASRWLGGSRTERYERWREASPLEYVDEKTPPFLFVNSSFPRFHAGRDGLITKLDEFGTYSEVHTLPGSPHSFWLVHPWFEPTLKYAAKFLDNVFRNRHYDFMVSQDGTGDFSSVQEAINAVPHLRKNRTRIFIRNGFYKEKLILPSTKTNVTFIGEEVEKTILVYDDFASRENRFGENIGTSGSSSFFIYGDGFEASNITFENSAGPVGQAVAVRVDGDRVKFENCRFLGNQDTLYPHGKDSRQYYKNCYIEGTVDFIFGWSTAVFDSCRIFCKRDGYITAASTEADKKFGFVFRHCIIFGSAPEQSVYLGRPWRPYARTVFLDCDLSNIIRPEGWHNWGAPEKEKTAFYAEYNNSGPGYQPSKRAPWANILSEAEASQYTLETIFEDWDPSISSP